MTNNGKAQVSAPKCTKNTQENAAAAATYFSNGLTTLNGALAVGATTVTVDESVGFSATGQFIIDPGTSSEEIVTPTNLASKALTVPALTKAHADEAVVARVVTTGAIRPGSVTYQNGTNAVANVDPNGTGVVSAVASNDGAKTLTGTINFALGVWNLTLNSASSNAKNIIVTDTLTDSPDDLSSGKAYFKSFDRMSNGRADLPTGAVISNLGSAEVGLFVESKATDKNIGFNSRANANAVIKGFGSKVVTFEGGLPSEMRIRAGADSQASMTPSTATERNNDPGVIDVAYFSVINANGGSN